MSNCSITVYRLINAGAAFDTGSDITVTTNAVSDTLNIPAGGAAIAGVMVASGTLRTSSWTGLSENTDVALDAIHSSSAASAAFAATQTALEIKDTFSGTPNGAALVMASWGPA